MQSFHTFNSILVAFRYPGCNFDALSPTRSFVIADTVWGINTLSPANVITANIPQQIDFIYSESVGAVRSS